MVTIQDLSEKYQTINSLWSFTGLEAWLGKKGIPQDIIDTTIRQTFADFTYDTLPPDNYIFDNTVLLRALITQEILSKERQIRLQNETQESLDRADAEWNKLGRIRKIWRVIVGKA